MACIKTNIFWKSQYKFSCAKNWHFFQKIDIFSEKLLKNAYFREFEPKSWDICGALVDLKMCKKLHFFSKSSHFPIQSLRKWPKMPHIRADTHLHKSCKKFAFFSKSDRKWLRNAYFREFGPKFRADSGRDRARCYVQKIHIFFTFFSRYYRVC